MNNFLVLFLLQAMVMLRHVPAMGHQQERDAQTLQPASAKNEIPQKLVQLADKYKSSNQYPEAIALYQLHIEKAGKDQEAIWRSLMMIGESYESMEQWDLAFIWFLKAYACNTHHAEPLLKIAGHYQKQQEFLAAYHFALAGLGISSPLVDQFDAIICSVTPHTPYQEEGVRAANRLILKKGVAKDLKEVAYKSLLGNISILKNIEFLPISFQLPPIIEGQPDLYKPMNASILKNDEGYLVLCRTVNYFLTEGGEFPCYDSKYRQKNFILHYDRIYQLISQHEMIEELPRKREYWINAEGIEDCRMIPFEHGIWFVGTTLDTNPFHERQISLGRLGKKTPQGTIQVDKLVPLLGPDPKRSEKNWMPVVKNGELHLIYSYDPFIVYQPDLETGECRAIEKKQPEHDFSKLRGSAPPIEFEDGYLMVVHETIFSDPQSSQPNKRYYLHRFAYLDQDCNIKKLSKPFTFKHLGVEFCAGIAHDHSGKNLVLGVSIEDKESYFGIVDLGTVHSMLEPLP